MKTKNTLLKKVIILFIIVLIPLISVSIVFLHRNNVRQKDDVLSSIESNTANYISQFDESLRQIYSSNIHILEQSLISDLNSSYPFLSVYERSVQLNLIRDQLYGICSISPFLSSAHVHFYNHEHIFSSANYKYGSFQILSKRTLPFTRLSQQIPDFFNITLIRLPNKKSFPSLWCRHSGSLLMQLI